MATITTNGVDAGKRSRGRSPTLTPRPPGAKRNRSAIILGLVLMVGCGGVAALLYADAAERPKVVVTARDVPAGTRITEADLGTAGVAADAPVKPIPAAARSKVVGRVPRVGLVAGTVLTSAQLARKDALPSGESVVAVLLDFGQAPKVAPGDQVLVVAPEDDLSASAEVFAVEEQERTAGKVRVSLLADESVAARIASVAAGQSPKLSLVVRSSP